MCATLDCTDISDLTSVSAATAEHCNCAIRVPHRPNAISAFNAANRCWRLRLAIPTKACRSWEVGRSALAEKPSMVFCMTSASLSASNRAVICFNARTYRRRGATLKNPLYPLKTARNRRIAVLASWTLSGVIERCSAISRCVSSLCIPRTFSPSSAKVFEEAISDTLTKAASD
jgi:hypothetical protein